MAGGDVNDAYKVDSVENTLFTSAAIYEPRIL